MDMERIRNISSTFAIIALGFGLAACHDVDAPAPDLSSREAETFQDKNIAPQSSLTETQSAANASKTDTEEEVCPEEEDDFFSELYHEWRKLVEELDVDTVNKPKKNLNTPYGVKSVYDPHQDTDIKIIFKKLYEERQEFDYFDDWPETFIERSQRKKARKHHCFGSGDVSFAPVKILRNARLAQRNDYIRAGCRAPLDLHCLLPSRRVFIPCASESQAAWGSSDWSDCEDAYARRLAKERRKSGVVYEDEIPLSKWPKPGEPKLCHFDEDLPSVSRPDGYAGRYLPFHEKQIGDPMRGTVEQQFDQYFAIECSKYRRLPLPTSE